MLMLAMMLGVMTASAQKEIVIGDMNGDNEINMEDLNCLISTILGKTEEKEFALYDPCSSGAFEMESSNGWTQTGSWSKIGMGITEAYGGSSANTNNDYNTHTAITLPKGHYKLTGYAFYRSGEFFDTDEDTSLAYMYAGDSSVKVVTLASVPHSVYPNSLDDALNAFYTDGDYKNVLYFKVEEDNTEVEIGYKGTHDPSTSKSWFICGKLSLEQLPDYEYVDLGLPSGTLWATMNVGAVSPEDFGGYYAWGETKAYSEEDVSNARNYSFTKSYVRENFSWNTYKWGLSKSLTKYCATSEYGTVDGRKTLELSDDAAYVNWGSGWRMPDFDEVVELFNGCKWTSGAFHDVWGYWGVSKYNGNKIFLPGSGYRGPSSLRDGLYGYYWSSTLDENYSHSALGLFFDATRFLTKFNSERCYGRPVRAVRR